MAGKQNKTGKIIAYVLVLFAFVCIVGVFSKELKDNEATPEQPSIETEVTGVETDKVVIIF